MAFPIQGTPSIKKLLVILKKIPYTHSKLDGRARWTVRAFREGMDESLCDPKYRSGVWIMAYTEKELEKKIWEYGRDILSTEQYQAAFEQVHHGRSSVAKHSLRVAADTLRVCEFFSRKGIEVDERKAVRAALLHDLGILGRYDKFKNNYETSRQHPVESIKVAREIDEDFDETIRQAIERHMFPVFAKPPTKPEAIAVCIADKSGSMRDVLKILGKWKKKDKARFNEFLEEVRARNRMALESEGV